ncbi:MAG TPA: hypothetical protein VFA04_28115 [Bryobacteraceae bacterium]|nr:hypothetical protein [Bryobacteraceae bacterium]
MRLRAFFAAAVLCLPATAATQWLRIRSTNFELLTTAGEKRGREAILYFEAVRRFFEQSKLMVRQLPTTPVRIVAFRSQKEYKPYAAKEFAAAYYQPGFQHDYIVMSGIERDDYPAAIHEYVHLLLRHTGVKVPLWFNEGLADMYSSLEPRGKKLLVGAPLAGHIRTLRETRLAPLELITSADEKSPFYNESSRVNIFYAESWALVHMLFWEPAYRPKFDAFLLTLVREHDFARAVQLAYGKSVSDIQKELFAYINGNGFTAGTIDLKLDTRSEDPDVDTMPAWDAEFAMAEIMSSSVEKAAAGRELLQKLAQEDPKRWEPEAGLGDLDLRERDRAKALQHYERAAQLNATSPEMYFHYATALQAGGDHEKRAAMLRKAVELKPDYEEAHFYLGFAYLDSSNYAGVVTEFKQVKHVSQENAFAYFSGLAYAEYRLNRKDEAKTAIGRAKQYAKDGAQHQQLDQMLAALEERPAAAAPRVTQAEIAAAERDEGHKALRRRDDASEEETEATAAEPPLPTVEGQFVELACPGETARMGVASGGKTTWFLMDDPRAIAINSESGPSVDLACGRQKPRKVRVHYVANEVDGKTAGLVRAIDFE